MTVKVAVTLKVTVMLKVTLSKLPRTIFKLVGPCEILSHGQKVPQKATKLSKISLKKINSTFET